MARGWMPPAEQVTQALGICFTADNMIVLISSDGQRWTLPGGTVEPGETVSETLIREVAEEACATVTAAEYLACQHVADPHHPDGPASYDQTRW
jgi:8-oxo-dGTP diphosphatase